MNKDKPDNESDKPEQSISNMYLKIDGLGWAIPYIPGFHQALCH